MKKIIETTKAISSSEHLHHRKQHLDKCHISKLPPTQSHQHQVHHPQEQKQLERQEQHRLPWQLFQRALNNQQKVQLTGFSFFFLLKARRKKLAKCNEPKDITIKTSSRPFFLFVMLLLFFHLIPSSNADWLLDCGDCTCKWNSGKKTANCNNLSLVAVPENLSPEVQVLDLSFNRISILEQNAFLNAELHNLQKLYIRNSSLQQIDPRTFTQLEILIEVDLSNNLLRSLRPNLFARLPKLRYLVLNGNLLEFLGEGVFQNLKYLHKIELQNNRLKQINTKAFIDLPLLSHIYLDSNRLGLLRKESFEHLPRLTALSLDQNPWNCTCELQIFRDYVIKHNLYTPPTSCYYPQKLRGMLWIEDQPDAFACKPKIIFPIKSSSISTTKENITLNCRVLTSPNTHINWDFNKKVFRSNTVHGERFQIELLKDEDAKEKDYGREVLVSRLTIFFANQHDEGVYSCLAENAAGKDNAQITLAIKNPNVDDLMSQGNVFLVICLMALCLVGISILMAMITFCIYKRFKANGRANQNDGHNDSSGGGQALTLSQESTPNVDPSHTQVCCGNEVSLCVHSESNQKLGKTANHHQVQYQKQHQQHQEQQPQQFSLQKQQYPQHYEIHQQNQLAQPQQQQQQQNQLHLQQQYHGNSFDELNLRNESSTDGIIGGNLMNDTSNEHFQTRPFHQLHENSNESQRGHLDNSNIEENNQDKLQVNKPQESCKPEFPEPDLLPSQMNNIQQSPLRNDLSSAPKQMESCIEETNNEMVTRNKYNTKVQEYLLAKYGTVKGRTQTKINNKRISDNVAKREAPSIPLMSSSLSAIATGISKEKPKPKQKSTSASVSVPVPVQVPVSVTTSVSVSAPTPTATSYKNTKSSLDAETIKTTETLTLTLQRHTKSLGLPQQTHQTISVSKAPVGLVSVTTSCTTSSTPTEFTNPYAYRQPPPPPYYSNHRTSTSFSNSNMKVDSNELVSSMPNGGSSKSLGMSSSRHTLVTSPSQNFLITTQNKVLPQSQLL